MSSEKEQVRKRVCKFYKENLSRGKSHACKQFLAEEKPKKHFIVLSIVMKLDEVQQNKKIPQRKSTSTTETEIKELK